MFAPAWSFGCPPRLASSGGCGTRFAQTVLAVNPASAPLLGHAEGDLEYLKKIDGKVVSWLLQNGVRFRPRAAKRELSVLV